MYAREQFKLDRQRKDGTTPRQHLMKVWEMTGVEPKELSDLPPFPESAFLVWGYFQDLSQFRGSSGFGPNSLTPADILAWSQLSRNRLELWEIRAISMLDAAYLSVMVKDEENE